MTFKDTVLTAIDTSKKGNFEGNEFPIKVAEAFLSEKCPDFLENDLSKDSDRLVKIGRRVAALVQYANGDSVPFITEESIQKLEQSLELVVDECKNLMKIHGENLQVPKVRFGKTNIQMPVVTVGCMRFQQSWNRHPKQIVKDMSDVSKENQENLKDILRYALKFGMNHIETARGYGSSEMQLGVALEEMFEAGEVKREDLIIQAKVGCKPTIKEFRETFDTSFKLLKQDYFDLGTFHGLNTEPEFKRVFDFCEKGKDNEDEKCNCLMDVMKEFVAAGKIKHVGFTSHGTTGLIRKALETNAFSYCNLHHHYLGNGYTTSGEGKYGGNLENIHLCHELDMGMFIISPFDKGGRLYAPSRKLRDLCLPELEPIDFGALWLWLHELHDAEKAPCHTITAGLARPSDIDQPLTSAIMHLAPENKQKSLEMVNAIVKRCEDAKEQVFGKEFLETWHHGLYNGYSNRFGTQLGCIAWFAIIMKSFGMVGYSKDRYESMESWLKGWDFNKTRDENIDAVIGGWGWMPGAALQPGTDYTPDLMECSPENRAKLLELFDFAHKHISKNVPSVDLPLEWQEAYDMRPWTATCELPPPKDEEKKAVN